MVIVFLAGAFVFLMGVVTGATIVRATLSEFLKTEIVAEIEDDSDTDNWNRR